MVDGFRDRMTPGTTVSAVGHVAVVGWILLGWGLNAEPLPFEVTQVSVVSGAEYAALVQATTPQAETEQPPAPETPQIEAPTPPASPEEPVVQTPPETPPEAPVEEAPPPPPPDPLPQVPVEVETPDPLPSPDPPAPDTAIASLPIEDRPQLRPADRVAPEAALPPPPDAEVAPQVQEAAEPEAQDPAETVEEPLEAAAPEEAATEIVTEADIPSGAVTESLRPPSRPAPAPPEVPETPAETSVADSENVAAPPDAATDAAVDDLLAELEAGAATDPAPAADPGPPMTSGEMDNFRVAVGGCWVRDPGSQADRTVVTVAFDLDRDGSIVGDVRLVNSTGESQAVTDAAFRSARSALYRCAPYSLPADKYEQWRGVDMTFDAGAGTVR